ncbi:uncharacterized protein UV8b_08280 [Ustilaginoidea virens]|uniref:Methyltransferase domain-containing protein n=1 Tax=Ustilaginoidea virens TaxID=1159556 RepID=A0A063BTB1_USTVR|nr:uncharacterized protein UV8b_08280 [Ustilaginoidea virens]QUC24039.1 hypothetical protein UV8b_08280 [Ustilaginoidea virens]GAO19186.1 hypothetical protein UVI_02063560 [Ustilaginoidea virens]
MPIVPIAWTSLDEYVENLCEFISSPIARQITGGIHVNDALIHNAWATLPKEWTDWWSLFPHHRLAQQQLIDSIREEADRPEASSELDGMDSRPGQTPESLAAWLARLQQLALPRTPREGPTTPLPEILTLRMTPKKIAEVSKVVAYIHSICQRRSITRVVDMGAGQGYLSVSLAYLFPQLRVLSIDGSEAQVAGSRSFSGSLAISEHRLKHLVHWIDGSPALAKQIEDWADGQPCLLVGLHACGSLPETMLRYFTTVSCIDAVAVVGCCYNHIVPRSPSCPDGFPISSALQRHNVVLSPTALMAGCQAPNNWKRKSAQTMAAEEDSVFERRRLYRAILEKIFFDKGIPVAAGADGERPIWGIRKGDVASFTKFARRAMECLQLGYETVPTAELVGYEERYKGCMGQISILWTLGVLCCKVVESVIAVDRYCFLREQGARAVDIVPIFDVNISPRNLMMVAEKEPNPNPL